MDGFPKVVGMEWDKATGELLVMYEDGCLARREWLHGEYFWAAVVGPDYNALFCKPMDAIKELANVAEEEVTGYRERRGDLEWTDSKGYVHGQRIGCPDCATEEDAYPEFVRDEETK